MRASVDGEAAAAAAAAAADLAGPGFGVKYDEADGARFSVLVRVLFRYAAGGGCRSLLTRRLVVDVRLRVSSMLLLLLLPRRTADG